MALARKCDRCGKLHEYYIGKLNEAPTNALSRIRKNINGEIVGGDNSLDLCLECMNEFNMWVIRGPKTEE